MTIRIVRLGKKRITGEGLRIGAVRYPPRGIKKSDYSAGDWFDVWYPNLAPSADLIRFGKMADTEAKWKMFLKKYRAEMSTPEASRTLDLLTALSHRTDFSVGCYCAEEARCHRSVLRLLFVERGAKIE